MSEGYCGIKFEVSFLKKEEPSHPQLSELKEWCRIFHEKNLAPPYPGGSYGNLSFRTNEKNFIITGTCMGLKGNLKNDCFVEVCDVDLATKKILVNGTRFPSSESMLHEAIYKARPDVNAIFHGHCSELLKNAARLGIPETMNEEPYGTPELVKSVLEIIQENSMIIMKNHGFISVASSMEIAGRQCIDVLGQL
jgi:L-fuculose-phosphate aldolase